MSKKSQQELHTLLYQLFSMTGSLTEIKQLDRLRMLSTRLGTSLGKHAREESVELMRRLQQAVISSFEKTFAANEELEKRIKILEDKVNAPVSKRRTKRTDLKSVPSDSKPQASD